MAGLERNSPTPTNIVVHQQSKVFEVEFSDGKLFRLPFELLPRSKVMGPAKKYCKLANVKSVSKSLSRWVTMRSNHYSVMATVPGFFHGITCIGWVIIKPVSGKPTCSG
jgi:hypothetical protein